MNLIDMHCDTLWRLTDLGGRGDLLENDGSVSLRLLEKEKALAQVFACFVHRDAMEGRARRNSMMPAISTFYPCSHICRSRSESMRTGPQWRHARQI